MSMVGTGESKKFLHVYGFFGLLTAVWVNLDASSRGAPSVGSVLANWQWGSDHLMRLAEYAIMPVLLWPMYLWGVVSEAMAQWFQR